MRGLRDLLRRCRSYSLRFHDFRQSDLARELGHQVRGCPALEHQVSECLALEHRVSEWLALVRLKV